MLRFPSLLFDQSTKGRFGVCSSSDTIQHSFHRWFCGYFAVLLLLPYMDVLICIFMNDDAFLVYNRRTGFVYNLNYVGNSCDSTLFSAWSLAISFI